MGGSPPTSAAGPATYPGGMTNTTTKEVSVWHVGLRLPRSYHWQWTSTTGGAEGQRCSGFSQPRTKKDVLSFLGLTGYYRRFIPRYATLALPLTDMTKKDEPNKVAWLVECGVAFQALKAALCSQPVLMSPNFQKEFVLQTDASDRGVGAVLSQMDDEGNDRPIAYYSHKLLPRQAKYSTVEKECLAIKLAVQTFHPYLMCQKFRIGHRYLSYWFDIEYRTGHRNGNADGLSRLH